MRAAPSMPSCTGSEPMPICRSPFDRLEVVQRHDAVRADAVQRGQRQRAPAGHRAVGHDGRAGDPGQAFVAQAAGGIAPPAVALQAHRRRAVGPGQQQADQRPRRSPTARAPAPPAATAAVQATATYRPQRPGMRPDGIGRCGSLMASTWRSNQSFTAWLVAHTSGPASSTPSSDQRPALGQRHARRRRRRRRRPTSAGTR